jgi:hypothetical protein
MEMKDENLNAGSESDISKRQPEEKIIRESQPTPEERTPIPVELKKTGWDRILNSAMVVITLALAVIAYQQSKVAKQLVTVTEKQAIAAEKQAALAKAQTDLVTRMNEEAKKSTLKVNLVVGASYVESNNVKGEIEMLFVNRGPRPTAVLSVSLRTKQGSPFKTISEPDKGKLPLNIGPWSAEKISFSLNKDDIKKLEDIVVTDIDGKLPPVKPMRWNASVTMTMGAVASVEAEVVTTKSVKVCKGQTKDTGFGFTLFVQGIELAKDSGRSIVHATIGAPGEKEEQFSLDKINACRPFREYGIRLHVISPSDCVEFSVSQGGKVCEQER